jgi:hypothetical protein
MVEILRNIGLIAADCHDTLLAFVVSEEFNPGLKIRKCFAS